MSRNIRLARRVAQQLGQLSRSRGSATLGLALVVASVAGGMALGTGVARHSVKSGYDLVWLTDSKRGQVVQVDPSANKANLRLQVAPAGDPLSIQQGGGHLIISDQRTGKTSSIDLDTLLMGGSRKDAAGDGVQVLLDGSRMYIANLATGVVQAVDPATEKGIGKPWSAGRRLVDVVLDGNHTVWALDDSNHLISLHWSDGQHTLAKLSSKSVTGSGSGSVVVGHDKGVTVVGAGGVITRVGTGSDGSISTTRSSGPLSAAPSSPGDLVPVSDPGNSSVVIVDRGTPKVDDVSVLGCPHPGDPVVFNNVVYVPCLGDSRVLVLDRNGQPAGAALRTPSGGDPQLVVGQDKLLITVPGAAYTTVIDRAGAASQIQVVDPTIGVQRPSDPPPPPPPPPTPTPTPTQNPGHSHNGGHDGGHGGYGGGHGGYGGGGNHPQGGGDHSSTPPAAGHPSGAPTSGVPSSGVPTGAAATGTATAAAQNDGTVVVSWVSTNDTGATYVISVVDGTKVADAPAGAKSATVTVLSPGTTAAFEVQAVKAASSAPLWTADTAQVTTYSSPGAVTGVSVSGSTDGTNAALSVAWTAAAPNGRPITYTVSTPGAASVTTTGTSAALSVPCPSSCSGTVTVTPSSAVGTGTSGSATYNTSVPPPPPPTPSSGASVVTVAGEQDGMDNGDGTSSPATVSLDITAPNDWAQSVGTTCTLFADGVNEGTVACNASHVSQMFTYPAFGTHTHSYYVTASWSSASTQSATVSATTIVPRPNAGCVSSAGERALSPTAARPAIAQCQQPCATPPCPLPASNGDRALAPAAAVRPARPDVVGPLLWFRKPQ